jgi:hypothetical protein
MHINISFADLQKLIPPTFQCIYRLSKRKKVVQFVHELTSSITAYKHPPSTPKNKARAALPEEKQA